MFGKNLIRIFASAFLMLLASMATSDTSRINVFAAASLKEALDDVAADYSAISGTVVTLSYAGSSTLARQIAAGAPVDVFVSANASWMDELQSAALIQIETRVDLLSNQLVLVGHSENDTVINLDDGATLERALRSGPLAMALVEAVPAGIYGKQALETFGLWQDVAARVAQTDNVRAALALVSLRAAALGVVYATDAQADPNVVIKARFPAGSHASILYPAAVTAQSTAAEAKAFLDYLQGDAAHKIFMKHGFSAP